MNDIDNPEITVKRKELLKNKTYLNLLYKHFYHVLLKQNKHLPPGKIIELGSGAGFLKEFLPKVITSDVLKLPFCDMQFSAEKIPFKNKSVAAFYLLNTFHHIKNPEKALKEMDRCLKKDGKIIMIEPASTLFSKIIYKYFHHEVFDENGNWQLKSKGPLSGSNQALAFIVFRRDKNQFRKIFPKLKILKYENHTPFNYLISGGFKYDALLPARLFNLTLNLEQKLSQFNNKLGMFTTIVIKKV